LQDPGAEPGGTLIAEIGGTSSRWAWCAAGSSRIFPEEAAAMPGFNPLNSDPQLFIDGVRDHFQTHDPTVFTAGVVKVYGAGCGTQIRRKRMRETLVRLWPQARILVDTDLMGAAQGMCRNGQGLVLILGTGMNAGWFNGSQLYTPMPSLGYILGDEGSGADIGRELLQDAFYDRIPQDVREMIFGAEGPDLESTLEEIYRSPAPARALASHTARLAGALDHPYVRDLIMGRILTLVELLKHFFTAEQRREVYATGSVAFGFQMLLSECLLEQGMTLVSVTKDPLRDLVLYEQQQ
jgi:glucosamine kinase